MATPEPPPRPTKRPPSRPGSEASSDASATARLRGALGTLGAVVVTAFISMGFAAYEALPTAGQARTVWAGVGLFVGLGTAILLIWRTRLPLPVFLISCGAALVFPISPLGALITLPWVVAHSAVRWMAWCTALATVVTAATLWRDARRTGEGVLFAATDATTSEWVRLLPIGYVMLGAVALAISVAAGAVRRSRYSAIAARDEADQQSERAAALTAELSRQDERDLIAREMHDTVAHHLSLVSLHASALETTAGDPGTDVPEAARSMRSSAQRALEEMRVLIHSLRDSASGGYEGSAPSLADLSRLVADAESAGAAVRSRINVDGDVPAPPSLARAVYRIVQESLTNALKHAPGAAVELVVLAAPGFGVETLVSNTRATSSPADESPDSEGSGLTGMRERATALSGSLTAGPHGDTWLVRAHLPWP